MAISDEMRAVITLAANEAAKATVKEHVDTCPNNKIVEQLSLEVWGQPGIEGTGLKDKVNGAMKFGRWVKWLAAAGGIGGIWASIKEFGVSISQK